MSNGQEGVKMPTTGGGDMNVTPQELFIMIGMKETEIAKLQGALMKLQQQNQQQAGIIKELQQKLAGTPDEPPEETKDPGAGVDGLPDKPEAKVIPKIKKIDKEA